MDFFFFCLGFRGELVLSEKHGHVFMCEYMNLRITFFVRLILDLTYFTPCPQFRRNRPQGRRNHPQGHQNRPQEHRNHPQGHQSRPARPDDREDEVDNAPATSAVEAAGAVLTTGETVSGRLLLGVLSLGLWSDTMALSVLSNA